MIRLVDELRPRYVLFENVRGLVTAVGPKGAPARSCAASRRDLRDHGYSSRIATLNAADYGAAQRRVRLYLIATADHELPEFPEPTHHRYGENGLKPWVSLGELLDSLPPAPPDAVVRPNGVDGDALRQLSPGTGLRTKGRVMNNRPGGQWGYRQDAFLADLGLPSRTIRTAADARLDQAARRSRSPPAHLAGMRCAAGISARLAIRGQDRQLLPPHRQRRPDRRRRSHRPHPARVGPQRPRRYTAADATVARLSDQARALHRGGTPGQRKPAHQDPRPRIACRPAARTPGGRLGRVSPSFVAPPRWTAAELKAARDASEDAFTHLRREEGPKAFQRMYNQLRPRVEQVFEASDDIQNLTGAIFEADPQAWQACRYLCGPPISQEDLWTLVGGPKFRSVPPDYAEDTAEAIRVVVDPVRFPWLAQGRPPWPDERELGDHGDDGALGRPTDRYGTTR